MAVRIVEFNLVENECLGGNFTDLQSSTEYLGQMNIQGVQCIPGNGVRLNESAAGARSIESSRNVTDLKYAIEQGGGSYTIETWVDSSTATPTELQYLYSLCIDSDEFCNFALHEQKSDATPLWSMFAMKDSYSLGTRGFGFAASSFRNSRTHISISVSPTTIVWYVQGQLVKEESGLSGESDSSKWFDEGIVRLLGRYGEDGVYSGAHIEMYYWSMWSPALSASETFSRYEAGSPNSRPVAHDVVARIQQNGEVGDHSSDPSFYSTKIASAELAIITLLPYDYDDVNAATEDEMVRAQITSLPSNGGTLYLTNGTEISTVPTEIYRDSSTGNFTVRFRPRLNVYSNSDVDYVSNFTYVALEGTGGQNLTSLSRGLVLITASHVNQPPVPASNSNATVFAGALTTLPALEGTDVDGTIVNATILALPGRGRLYEVYPNGSIASSELTANSPLSTFSVAYIYSGPQSAAVNSDSFTFAVTDDDGFTSVPATYSISVEVAVVAIPAAVRGWDDQAMIVEGGTSTLSLGGIDYSDARRVLCPRISSAPRLGSLFDPADPLRTPLTAGDTLSSCISNYSMGVDIGYNASAHFFTWPSGDWQGQPLAAPFGSFDGFQWHLVSEDGSLSEVVTQNVSVLNRNSPTAVQYDDAGDGGEIKVRPIAFGEDSSVSITGFALFDPDLDTDVVRARLVSEAGARLTLHRSYIDRVDFNSATYCYSNLRWQCKGSGYTEDEMSFVGTPSAVALALSSVTYQSSKAHSRDTVTLTVYDGEGGECLDLRKLSASRFQGCHERSASVSVTVLGYEVDNDDDTIFEGDPHSFFLSNAILFGMIAVCICCCCAAGRLLYRCCCRGRKDDQLLEREGDVEARQKGTESPESPTSTTSSATLHLDNIYPSVESAFSDVVPEKALWEGVTAGGQEYPWPTWPERQHLSVLSSSPASPLSQTNQAPSWLHVDSDP